MACHSKTGVWGDSKTKVGQSKWAERELAGPCAHQWEKSPLLGRKGLIEFTMALAGF